MPGNYALQIGGGLLASSLHPFEIRAGADTRLDVPVQAGVAATIECTLPEGAIVPRSVAILVRDAANALVWRGSAWPRSGGTLSASLVLRPGNYSVEADAGQLRATGSFSVVAPGPAKVMLALRRT